MCGHLLMFFDANLYLLAVTLCQFVQETAALTQNLHDYVLVIYQHYILIYLWNP